MKTARNICSIKYKAYYKDLEIKQCGINQEQRNTSVDQNEALENNI